MTTQWGEVGPEKDGFNVDCQQIRAHLETGRPVMFQYSHRATGYRVFLTPYIGTYRYDGSWAPRDVAKQTVLVAIESHGAYPFTGGGWRDPGYVGQKLGLSHEVDAEGVMDCLALMLPGGVDVDE